MSKDERLSKLVAISEKIVGHIIEHVHVSSDLHSYLVPLVSAIRDVQESPLGEPFQVVLTVKDGHVQSAICSREAEILVLDDFTENTPGESVIEHQGEDFAFYTPEQVVDKEQTAFCFDAADAADMGEAVGMSPR